MSADTHPQRSIKQLQQLIAEEDVAMMTTRNNAGHLRSRPMATVKVSAEAEVFFFTMMDAELAQELTDHDYVSLSYTRADQKDFVSVSGVAQLFKDETKMRELWRDKFKKWVPNGLAEPNLALLKVAALHAEHWGADSKSSGVSRIFTGNGKNEYVHELLD